MVMKLIINYDLINEISNTTNKPVLIKNLNEIKLLYPSVYIANFLVFYSILPFNAAFIASTVSINWALVTFSIICKYFEIDPYKIIAEKNLNNLVLKLKDLHIDTTYDLLLDSKVYYKKNNLKINEKKIPYILESKYILVPTYDSLGEITKTSVLQEHVVGSKKYVLSIGSPEREYKYAFSNL